LINAPLYRTFLKKNTIFFNYVLYNTNLTRKYIIKDLGVSFDTKLSFTNHVDFIRNKAFMKLGLLKRMCNDFNDSSALKILYYSLVCSHIDYASLIRHSDSICQNQSLSRIQNNFLRYLSFKCHFERRPHSR